MLCDSGRELNKTARLIDGKEQVQTLITKLILPYKQKILRSVCAVELDLYLNGNTIT